MSQGYEQFFKKAKNSKKAKTPQTPAQEAYTAEEYLRTALKVRSQKGSRKRARPPLMAIVLAIAGVSFGVLGYFYPDKFEKALARIEVGVFSDADAADGTKGAENTSSAKAEGKENSAAPNKELATTQCVEKKGFSEEELSHFNKLNDRNDELDRREAELNSLEEELHKQKEEVESRMAKLEQIRGEVANVLKERVEVDQQRVSTLVDFYSNMKPKQAAEIFANLNEDLAVEVLGKMKKKSAADILNLLDATKARALSEKFTGYKRR